MPVPNPLRDRFAAGKPVANAWISLGHPFAAELVAGQGYDSVGIDMQHGMAGFSDVLGCLLAVRASGATPIVRVPSLDPPMITKVLDAGALGIICPMIDTAAQADGLVKSVRYPPLGERSSGPTRALTIHQGNYVELANTEIATFAMIETQAGVDNLEAIVQTAGLTGVYIGPSDLSISLSKGSLAPGFDRQEPEMVATIRRIIDTAHAAGIKAALHCGSSEYAAKAVGWGADMVTLLNDVRMLAAAAAQSVKVFRDLTANSQKT